MMLSWMLFAFLTSSPAQWQIVYQTPTLTVSVRPQSPVPGNSLIAAPVIPRPILPNYGLAPGIPTPFYAGGPLSLPSQPYVPSGIGAAPLQNSGVTIPGAAPLVMPTPNFSPIAPSATSNSSDVTMATSAEAMNSPLPILPNGNSWLSLPSNAQRVVTASLASDPEFSGLVSRLSVLRQNILIDDVHRATEDWRYSRSRPNSDLTEAYRATLVSRSGVVRVLPHTQWQLYSEMRSDPESLRGQALRYAANETLYTEYRSYPVAVALSDENRAQLQGAITELHLLNLVLDHTHLSDQRDIVTVLNYGTTARDQINAFIEGVRSRSVEELRGLAVAAVAAALPAPAAVVLGTAALYHVSNSILSGELQTAVVGFKDRITGVDPVERARALGEATTAVVAALTGLRVTEMGAVLATRIGARMNIAAAGAELAVVRETAQTILNDLRREVQLPLREISDSVLFLRVLTPQGEAVQAITREAILARAMVADGRRIYRIGMRGQSNTGQEAQFWSLDHPLTTPNFGMIYGIPERNLRNIEFIETGRISSEAAFITRPAPGVDSNLGGGIEIVVPQKAGSITIESHVSL